MSQKLSSYDQLLLYYNDLLLKWGYNKNKPGVGAASKAQNVYGRTFVGKIVAFWTKSLVTLAFGKKKYLHFLQFVRKWVKYLSI